MLYRQKGRQKFERIKLPYVVAKSAQTLDGKIATSGGDSKWITSSRSRQWARRERDRFDAILIGVNTVLRDNPGLNGTGRGSLKKIVLDASLRTPAGSRLFEKMPPRSCILATTKKSSLRKRRAFEDRGVIIIICPVKDGRVDLKWLLRLLARNGVHAVLLEGGATVVGQALKSGLVDEMHTYIAPKVLGDQKGLSAVIGRRTRYIRQTIALKFIHAKKIGEDVLIISHVLRDR